MDELELRKKSRRNCWIGFIFVAIFGSLGHFAYGWSGEKLLVGLFTPINESVWEHGKLIFFPVMLYGIWGVGSLERPYSRALSAYCAGAVAATLLMPVIFYTYVGISGGESLVVDILSFLLEAALAFWIIHRRTVERPFGQTGKGLVMVLAALLGLAFIIFTIAPPALPIFIPQAQ